MAKVKIKVTAPVVVKKDKAKVKDQIPLSAFDTVAAAAVTAAWARVRKIKGKKITVADLVEEAVCVQLGPADATQREAFLDSYRAFVGQTYVTKFPQDED